MMRTSSPGRLGPAEPYVTNALAYARGVMFEPTMTINGIASGQTGEGARGEARTARRGPIRGGYGRFYAQLVTKALMSGEGPDVISARKPARRPSGPLSSTRCARARAP